VIHGFQLQLSRDKGQMRLSALWPLLSAAAVGVMLASSASPQSGPEPHSRSIGTPGIEAQSDTSTSLAREAVTQTSEATLGSKKTGSSILITIDKAKQEMIVAVDGVQQYQWAVSTGRLVYSTPSGTYTPTSMNEVWYSKEWDNTPMPHAIFFMKDGHAIHGSYAVKALGKPVSHGCVRISPQNAATLYALVEKNGLENTQVVLTGVTPGGESNDPAEGLTGWSAATADERSSDVQSKAEAEIAITRELLQSNDWNKNDPTATKQRQP
jgi:lipoprotein-anchoring transpeptidase ErfK/SrfK